MAVIVPIRGVRYDTAKVGDVRSVVTPPYDVIDAAAQNMYYERNPNNVIRLELNKTTPEDDETNNRYTRAAHTFQQWLNDGVLVHEAKPSLYLYQQEFQVKGETLVRSGFICGVKAEDYSKGSVLPHEETLPKHKADRLNLMRAALANFSPIFGLYSDPEHGVEAVLQGAKTDSTPDIEVLDDSGVLNRLWVISDSLAVEKVVQFMSGKKIFIADGHHRYETAVNFGKEMSAQGKEGYDFVLIALVNLYDRGLVVFPTHRLVHNVQNLDTSKLITGLEADFIVEMLPTGTDLNNFLTKLETAGETGHSFGIYTPGKLFYLLKLRDEASLDKLNLEGRSTAWKRLDVSILHTLILEKHLDIGSRQRADESNLTYTRDEAFALESVDNGSAQLCFFMNPTKVEEVTDIATGGEKMPQKSTYFYPKIVTGLVINDFSK